MSEEKLITLSAVLALGWTKTMVNHLLPKPKLVSNPVYISATPMRLYSEKIVMETMETDAYKIAHEKSVKRKAAANITSVDDETLQRWIVNYIRHNLVRYDVGINIMKGRPGKSKLFERIKQLF